MGGGAKRKQNIKQKNMEKNINEIREEALRALQIEKDELSAKIDDQEDEKEELENQKEELENQIAEIEEEMDDIKERENEEE